MKKGIVMSVFAGLGKTVVGNIYPNVCDLQSSPYRCDYTDVKDEEYEQLKCAKDRIPHPEWPDNYVSAIKSAIEEYDVVLVPSNQDIRELLSKNNIEFVFVLPSMDSKDMLEKRYRDRGNNEEMIQDVMKNFGLWSRDQKDYPYKIEILPKDQYLKDMLVERGYINKEIKKEVKFYGSCNEVK